MKKFLAILILIFTLQTPSQADDIRDFQIEGMSIGDSLLDYFSKKKILASEVNWYEYLEKNKFLNSEKKNIIKYLYFLFINFLKKKLKNIILLLELIF